MSLLRADKIANRFNNSGPIIVGPSTVSGNFTVTGILTALGIGVTNNVLVGGGLTTKFLTATNSASLFNSTLTGITTAKEVLVSYKPCLYPYHLTFLIVEWIVVLDYVALVILLSLDLVLL